jgi:hypothetical protein
MKDYGTNPQLTRAYEIGFTRLADYCIEQYEKHPGDARRNIFEYIIQFKNYGPAACNKYGDMRRIKNQNDELAEDNKGKSIQLLYKAYTIGFMTIANYCKEQYKKHYASAEENIQKYIDKFYSKGIYAFILPGDQSAIKKLTEELRGTA